jgi:hypothetical protein
MPVAHWHEQIGDPTIADSILDRLVHNAYRFELKGESMRKKRRKPGEGGSTMTSARMRLKSAAGWFAAGREVAEAMGLLSDTAFKLFIWLACMRIAAAERSLPVRKRSLALWAKPKGRSPKSR